jgi:hypothetical protein
MNSNLDRFTADLNKLTSLGDEMLVDLSFHDDRATGSIQKQYEELAKKTAGSFEKNYQIWYTQACAVVNSYGRIVSLSLSSSIAGMANEKRST